MGTLWIKLFVGVYLWNMFCQQTLAVTTPCECEDPSPSPPGGCSNPLLYSAPDGCGCLYWYCDQLPHADLRAVCPQDWKSYVNGDGLTFCVKAFQVDITWLNAHRLCDNNYNADLFNVRRFEKFSENNSTLYQEMLDDIAVLTNRLPHWSGLHVNQGKLYWDSEIPRPDRDLTAAQHFGYEPASGSLVNFNSQDWVVMEAGRQCFAYTSQDASSSASVKLQPEYCSAGLPFICYKEIAAPSDGSAAAAAFYKPADELLCGGEEGWAGDADSGLCYKYFPTLLPSGEAQQMCVSNNGYLADPRYEINQRFLLGMLSSMVNGTAPLTLHVGMRASSSLQTISFDSGEELRLSALKSAAIMAEPSTLKQCGVFNNPYYAVRRLNSGHVQFEECSTARPFICTREFSSQKVADKSKYNMTVSRKGYELTCKTSGLDNLPGNIVWKKDYQYFVRQNHSASFSLSSSQFKYMIGDDSSRVVGHAEMAGVYVCEFWQTYPAHQYSSDGLSVTFNDTTSLRMSTQLPEIGWSLELEAFNHRVSHQDELTPEVQRVHDVLLDKVETILTPLTPQTVQYGINILQLRATPDNKVEIEYRITLTGDQVLQTRSSNDSYLQNVLETLGHSNLVINSTTSATNTKETSKSKTSEGIEGQFMCLRKDLVHPDTQQKLTLPLRTSGVTVDVRGDCKGEPTVMLTATCHYNQRSRKSTWVAIRFKDCNVNCLSQTVTHTVSKESFNLPTAIEGQVQTYQGECGRHEQDMFSAVCKDDKWEVTEIECVLMCLPKQINHSQWPVLLPADEVAVGTNYTFDMLCDAENKTIITAECVLNSDSTDGIWVKVDKQECSPSCEESDWFDSITNQTYTIKSAKFEEQSTVEGSCGGEEQVLLIANCTGDMSAGVFWHYQPTNCTPSCLDMNVTHPDTGANISIPARLYGEKVKVNGQCDGEDTVIVSAVCGGDITKPPTWTEVLYTNCTGHCSPVSVKYIDDGDERDEYILEQGAVGDVVHVNGTCALVPFVEISAECVGTAKDGGQWNYTVYSCNVDTTCLPTHFVHPDLKTKLSVNRTEPGETVNVFGECKGEEVVLLNVTCKAKVAAAGTWVNETYTDCDIDLADQLTNLLENFKSNPLELTSLTAKMSEDLTNSTDEEISLMVNIVEFVASPNTTKSVEKEGEFFFDIVSNMMDANLGSSGTEEAEQTGNTTESDSSANRLAKSVEGFLGSAGLDKPHIRLERANLLVEVQNTSSLDKDKIFAVETEKLSVTLPQSTTNGSTLSFVKYASPVMFPGSKQVLSNTVFSVSVADTEVTNSEGAINFTLNVGANATLPELAVCSYWNFTISDWSTEGCQMIDRDNESVTCTCNHLTNFAILLDVAGQENYIDEKHHIALSVITTVGLSISILALSLHLISFMFINKLRENQFQKVLANLSLSILISNVIFLAGINRTENNVACIAVAALLHYFILASFAWMFVEAFMQYRRFVKVLGAHVSHILLKAGLPAWIVPAVPVAIVMIIEPELYRGGERFCWMKPEALYYSFLVPVAIVIIANIVLFILILRGLTCARPTQLRTNKSEGQMRMMYFKAAIAIFTLLGLTWVFGFLAISDARLPFQYLFCITNAFQGLVIFLLHNIRDPKVLAWWRTTVFRMKPVPSARSGSASSTAYLKKSGFSRSTTTTITDYSTTDIEPSSLKTVEPVKVKNDSGRSSPSSNKLSPLEQSKLIHSSTESEDSGFNTSNM